MKIVVPSRKRAHNMMLLRELLPSATVCVEESERDDYLREVPKEKLWLHPPLKNAADCRNWIIDNAKEDIIVMVDDDFCGVRVTVGSHRFITDHEEILGIIENSARCCQDLNLSAFCWSGTPNTTFIHPRPRAGHADPASVSGLRCHGEGPSPALAG